MRENKKQGKTTFRTPSYFKVVKSLNNKKYARGKVLQKNKK